MEVPKFIPYQYSIIRYYHDATTHEFLNIGVAVWSPPDYFTLKIKSDPARIIKTFCNADGIKYTEYVEKLNSRFAELQERVSANSQTNTTKNIDELLRLYLRREGRIQYGNVSSGIAPRKYLDHTFYQLFCDYVNKYIAPPAEAMNPDLTSDELREIAEHVANPNGEVDGAK